MLELLIKTTKQAYRLCDNSDDPDSTKPNSAELTRLREDVGGINPDKLLGIMSISFQDAGSSSASWYKSNNELTEAGSGAFYVPEEHARIVSSIIHVLCDIPITNIIPASLSCTKYFDIRVASVSEVLLHCPVCTVCISHENEKVLLYHIIDSSLYRVTQKAQLS